ncbi:hypothetical protein D3C72_748510 [compost metagenome]
MLVLADTDGFWLDLHQFRQRILKTAGDGNGAAQRNVEIGELRCRTFRRGINGCARFRDDDLGGLCAGSGSRHLRQKIGHQLFRLAAARAVADGDQLDIVFANEQSEFRLRTAHVILRREGIDRRGFEQLASTIHDRNLHAGTDAGIKPHGGAGAGGGCQQQVLQIAGEDIDRLFFRPLAQLAHQIERQRHGKLHPPGPASDLHQPLIGRPRIADIEGGGDGALRGLYR